ncbi:MAG: F0F1 ATP synthase subunit B [Magnetococcales bacterium]|nr:F0F1 ATP synthase subunit B [Magnetococcales bacterium]
MIATAYAATGEHATAGSGMPQFEPSVFQHEIIWSIASFFILLYLLRKYVLPPIEKILDERSGKIRSDLDAAEKSRLDAEKISREINEQLSSARKIAEQTIEDARQETARFRDHAREALNQELAKKKNTAMAEIEAAKQAAMAELHHAIVDISMLATEKLIAKSMSKNDVNKVVQETLTAIQDDQAKLH